MATRPAIPTTRKTYPSAPEAGAHRNSQRGGNGGERSRRANARRRGDARIVSPAQRVVWVFGAVALGYAALAGRLVYIQVGEHERYVRMAQNLREHTRTLLAGRGALLDRDGTVLVRNEPAGDIILDPNFWYENLPQTPKPVRTRRRLPFLQAGLLPGRAEPADIPPADPALDAAAIVAEQRKTALDGLAACIPNLDVAALAEKIGRRNKAGRLCTLDVRRQVDAATADKVRKANLPGVGVLPSARRVALNGELASHLLGYTDIDGTGIEGLERGLDAALRGKPGVLEAEFDGRGRPIPGTTTREQAPQPGDDIVLTIDARLQHDVQNALRAAYEKHRAEAATAIVLDPRTGDILALANYPAYNVNQRGDYSAACRNNRAVTLSYEPGSTLKVITIAAALEENKVSLTSSFYCGGSRQIGGYTIHCAHGEKHGTENLTGVIQNSCNLATAEAAFRLGKDTLWNYERLFGFGARTGAGLPAESPGQLSPSKKWSDIQLANVAFGQGIGVTSLQLAAAYAAIANDGVWMRPRIVRGARSGDGAAAGAIQEIAPDAGRRVVSPDVAQTMRRMLETVIEHGTGTAALLDGYSAGGKTGTAQIAEHHHYSGKYVSSFVGMAPASHPQFVILVAVTAPTRGGYFGGVVAAPVFKEIAEKALLARRTPHDRAPRTRRNQKTTPASSVHDD